MYSIRRAFDRGNFDHRWLRTSHTFSFGEYHSAEYTQFRALRVMNEDWVQPGRGFGRHPHRDMEIITIVLEGALEHRDSLGNGEVLRPGEVQRMTAGTGIEHSEFNPSSIDVVHLYQIWLLPRQKRLAPGYEQKVFDRDARINRWQLIASPDGDGNSVTIHQDARLLLTSLTAGATLGRELLHGRFGWLQVLSGSAMIGTDALATGDGVAIREETRFDIHAKSDCDLLFFDLA